MEVPIASLSCYAGVGLDVDRMKGRGYYFTGIPTGLLAIPTGHSQTTILQLTFIHVSI